MQEVDDGNSLSSSPLVIWKKKNQNIDSPYVCSDISTQVTSENLAVDKENISICATE